MEPSSPDHPSISSAKLELLQRLESLLVAESQAIRALDYRKIDEITALKQALDLEIESATWLRPGDPSPSGDALDPATEERCATMLTRVKAMARDNAMRLQICLETVQSLIGAMTGTSTQGYSRRAAKMAGYDASSVLTNTVG